VGGLVIGVLQNLADGYLSCYIPGGVKEVFPFAVMVIILLFKPYGLWGWTRIERV
jgi:branched-chain amino acid transport system permease protein